MFFRSIAIVLLLKAVAVQVNGIPLRVVGPGEGSPDEIKRVKDATADAHGLVEKMETVHAAAQAGDAGAMAKVRGAFGVAPNMAGIGTNIQTLKGGKFKMGEAKNPNMLGPGAYNPNTDKVELGSGFHLGTTPEQRAGQILHESSHAVLGTKDVFNKHGQPTDQQKATNAGDKTGYRDSNLEEMKGNPAFSQNLHQNADSWRVFGDLCRRELERRAYEETDLVKRDEILESRAAACAMRPPTKNAAGAKGGAKKASAVSGAATKGAVRGGASRGSKTKPAALGAKRPAAGAKKLTPARGGAKKLTTALGGAKKLTPARAGAKKPVAVRGGAKKPVAVRGGAKKPVAVRGGAKKPVAVRGGAKKPVAVRGGAKKPAAVRGGTKKPAAVRGGAKKPAAVRGGAKKPASVRGGSKPAPVRGAKKPAAARPASKLAAKPAAKPAARPAVKPATLPKKGKQ